MISTVLDLWTRVNQYSAKYQSGQNVVAAFNASLTEVQNEIYNDLSPFYQGNEKVRGLLAPWVKSISATFTNGVYTTADAQFDRPLAISATDGTNLIYDIAPITEGELVSYTLIPQRKPDLAKKRVYYLMATPTVIHIFPKPASLPFLMYYLGYPTLAKIAFTYTETDDEDVMTYDAGNSTQLGWSQDAFNIILYKMLEKYGIDTRDQWIAEYSRLGISKPILNTGGNQ